ncbi:uncharacterized protein LOC108106834 [Drosophila eugracilis]|uniref:uncharacterized protein LOC108106834 n=1 Tax=Drosophila eugracilis TaxID=29029 RepID=UPI001BDB494C|nr:uncharacterized protein LOC108106834 [Drosophila eugracilis]
MFAQKFGYNADGWVLSISNEIRFNKLVLRHDTKLISQSVGFSSDTRYVEIQAKGTGAVLIQISHQYDLEEKEANPSYRIQTTIKPRTSSSKLELNVCVDFVEKSKLKKSGMAILEVSLPSGYISDKSSYKQILDIERVRFVDTKNEKTVVMVYFEKSDQE